MNLIYHYTVVNQNGSFSEFTSSSWPSHVARRRITPYLYVFGGTEGFRYSNDLHRFNLLTHRWQKLSGAVQSRSSSFNNSSSITAQGLPANPDQSDLERFYDNQSQLTWPRYKHETAVWADELWVLGGKHQTVSISLDKVHRWHLIERRWSTVQLDWTESNFDHQMMLRYQPLQLFSCFQMNQCECKNMWKLCKYKQTVCRNIEI